MRPIRRFIVIPRLPERLEPLRDLAYNLWWTWDMEAIRLFLRLDRELWETCHHNPVDMLGRISQQRLEDLAADEGFLAHLDRVLLRQEVYSNRPSWYETRYATGKEDIAPTFAYFSMEFGLNECLPTYSGGLGVLAGDHIKSASDLGLPLVGVGLLYRRGYFRQYLNIDGWQQEKYPENDFFNLPVEPVTLDDGAQLTVAVDYPDRQVLAAVWKLRVGRVPVYMLDADVEANRPEDRKITAQLYGGDLDMRIRQEILLGIGGIRALRAVGVQPTVCHMNEGHSAFLALERINLLMSEKQIGFDEAREATSVGNVFTTHTPVPAGNDMFPESLMKTYFHGFAKSLGLSWNDFLGLGRKNPQDHNEPFCMTVLALRLSAHSNGVSQLHGQVSREMWQEVWPDVPREEIPIHSITNGIHTLSWISHDMASLFDRYLGPRWQEDPSDPTIWTRVDQIPDAELWRTHERRRERLVASSRSWFRWQMERRGASRREVELAEEILDPEALTIGFARRFATYKRATLLLRDPERLIRLLNNRERPVQIIFAGKAHPADTPGKELIRQIVHMARDERLRRLFVFLEDYDMSMARYMVQGVDVWLNNPTRPLEASGTSGMKVVPNGGLNLSVPDGWWDEADRFDTGWTIGRGETYDDKEYQDEVESRTLFDLLEKEIIPTFYERGPDGLPRRWIATMKNSMRKLSPAFSTNRMVQNYTEQCYLISASRWLSVTDDNLARAKSLAEWKRRMRKYWHDVAVVGLEADDVQSMQVREEKKIHAKVHLGHLTPADVSVELYHGVIDVEGSISQAETKQMICSEKGADGVYDYVGSIVCRHSGQYGYSVRITPHHEDLPHPFEPDLITWTQQGT